MKKILILFVVFITGLYSENSLNGTLSLKKMPIEAKQKPTASTINNFSVEKDILNIQLAPINPDFVKYMEKLNIGTIPQVTKDGYNLGFIHPPIKYHAKIPTYFVINTTLPPSYDLRDEGKVTSAKNQESCGSCWTFATYASIESKWLISGLGSYDLSENNLNYGHGFEFDPCEGGNYNMSTAYLSRGDGPISETDDPYEGDTGSYHSGLTPQAHITGARFLPNDDDNLIKQMIYDYGALFTNLYWGNDYLNNDFTYYYNGDEGSNHAVTLVGWDDNKVVAGAPGNGAWIIKNSWGDSWGDNGYFHVSYYDIKINSSLAMWPDRINYNPNTKIHYYDKLGATSAFGWSDDTDYGLVKFTVTENQRIEKIGTWIYSDGNVRFEIYDNFDGTTLTNLRVSTNTKVCEYPGYYTFDLPTQIELNTGDDIYVKIEYNTPGYQYSIPYESAWEGYAVPEISSGIFWASNTGLNGSWVALGNGTSNEYDPCVKLYGNTAPTELVANFTSTPTSGNAPLTVNFTDLSTGSPINWSWNFGDGDMSDVQNPTHIYENTGSYAVSLTVSDGTESDNETKISYINVSEVSLDTLLSESFEVLPISDWVIYNIDSDDNQWGIFGELASDGIDLAHTGDASAGIKYNPLGNNDWLITPQMNIPENSNYKFSFWAKSMDSNYLEDFNVKLSITGSTYTDFTTTLESITSASPNWTKYSYDLSSYSGQSVYMAIQCVSVDKWYLFADDFFCVPNHAPTLAHVENQTMKEDAVKEITLSATDVDGDDLTYFALSSKTSIIASISSDVLTLTPTANWNGVANITVIASDGCLSDSIFFALTINAINDVPTAFNLISPEDNAAVETLTPMLDWESSFDPDSLDTLTYTVYYGIVVSDPNVMETDTATLWQVSPSLEDNSTYYWKVVAKDLSGATRENIGGYHKFFINTGNDNPTIAEPISPDSVIVLTLNPKFTWKASIDYDPNDEISYKMRVWNTTYRDSVVTDSNSCFANIPLSDNSEYTWDVVATDKTIGMSQSGNTKFWTDLFPEPPVPFNTISPVNGQVFESTIVDLLWNDSKDPDPLDYTSYTVKYKSVNQDSTIWHEVEVGQDTSTSLDLVLGNRYEWQVIAKDDDGFEVISDSSNLRTFDVGNVSGLAFGIPEEYALTQNYPNPFNPTTTLKYGLPGTSNITLNIFDITGRKIKQWSISNQQAGWHEVIWDGTNMNGNTVSTGVYIYSLRAGDFVDTKKMVFMK